MKINSNVVRIFALFIITLVFVSLFSAISTSIWKGGEEKIHAPGEFIIDEDMTIAEFGKKNDIPAPVLARVFGLKNKQDREKSIPEYNMSATQITQEMNKALALYYENKSKNWIKIVIKFMLWFLFLAVVFVLMRKSLITPKLRKWLYAVSIIIFGIALGSDPSPMGTVKDAVALYGANRVIFMPRMIALFVFLLLVVIANKYICSWGCQLGVLQDFIFRLNRNKSDTKGIIRQYKLPFVVTNGIRISFFIIFTLIAFTWATDIFEHIDPFKYYNPAILTAVSWVFILAIFGLSLFVYRPWCHLFCPFGLVGWLFEKLSIYRIKVNYDTCIACKACARACPSNVMDAILRRENVIPDCFACATCIKVCPTGSIEFKAGKRELPPDGKFDG